MILGVHGLAHGLATDLIQRDQAGADAANAGASTTLVPAANAGASTTIVPAANAGASTTLVPALVVEGLKLGTFLYVVGFVVMLIHTARLEIVGVVRARQRAVGRDRCLPADRRLPRHPQRVAPAARAAAHGGPSINVGW
jgi:hypothetical protein